MPEFRKGLVGAGIRGELICRILLSMAWDGCQGSKVIHEPVVVKKFLQSLGGKGLLEAFAVPAFKPHQDRILNGRLYFTHFVYLDYEVNNDDMLRALLSRGQAVLCRNNQQAIDLLIPIVLSDNKTVSFIAIQCKNRKKISWKGAVAKYSAVRMGFHSSTSPYLVLCMQVGTGSSGTIRNLTVDPKSQTGIQNIVTMQGLQKEVFPILEDEKLVQALEALRTSWEDPLSFYENQKGMQNYEKMLRKVMSPTYTCIDEDDPMDTGDD
jgi:hypothetical protein